MIHFRRTVALTILLLLPVLVSLPSCGRDAGSRIVVYCAHDREFAEEVLQAFEKETGLKVDVRWDTEANKSVQLYEDLIREASKPRCDVHWNNEILATIRLQQKGILQSYASPSGIPFSDKHKAADSTWTAFAARARVLIVNTERVGKENLPKILHDLVEPRFKGQIAMARPLFGTTATHSACLFQVWGKDKASNFFRRLHANGIEFVPGNKQVAAGVGAGQFAIGLTDTDDAVAEIEAGKPVAMIFPEGETLLIPNTVAMIKRCPNPQGAKRLIDYLLSPDVERKLANSGSRQIPLNPQVKVGAIKHLEAVRTAQAMAVDWVGAVENWQESQMFLAREFGLR